MFAAGERPDSLSTYLEQAARNNPQVQSDFMLYKAALERVPQAGALPDPELKIGFFLKPMETLMGEQVADFTLMQMFPWFGTQKAARSEAQEMARMAYEKFRDSRNNLWYEVKAQWYRLSNLNEQYKNTQAN
ncbi:TolC family protein, partial [Bacteroides heparinolyticus]